jgi:hypothetical protein
MTHEPAARGTTAWEIADARVALFTKFARAHLRTPAQRAAYLALAGTPDEAWSAPAIAAQSNVDAHEVDITLRQFTAAGITEDAGHSSGGDQLYRWHPTMAYLHQHDQPSLDAVDPVCGMPVPASTQLTETTGDQVQRFCSIRCQAAWRTAARELFGEI